MSHSGERGEAIVEFVMVAVLVLVPLAYAGTAVMAVQAAGTASAHAVREAGRAFALAAHPGEGIERARAAARLALADQGFAMPGEALEVRCSACLSPGSSAEIALRWDVPLPFLPAWLGSRASVPVTAEHVVGIDRYRDG